MDHGWIGIDLDGTLAFYSGWDGGRIGSPIEPMRQRVLAWLAEGKDCRIMTARVSPVSAPADVVSDQIAAISAWCLEHLGQILPVTHEKDFMMCALYDDRTVAVEANTGRLLSPELT